MVAPACNYFYTTAGYGGLRARSFAHGLNLWLDMPRIRRIAVIWCLVAPILLVVYLALQRQVGLTDGNDRPFGEDFLNFWSAARLAISGRATLIYDLRLFHDFQQAVVGGPIDLYHYSYPPVMLLLTAPIGLLPYEAGWLVWQVGGWLAFALAVRRVAPSNWFLLALAPPAILINAIGGQNGCWIAAVLGWGLILLERRPMLAGAILALLVVKPQLAWLVPLALLAGREYRAVAALCLTAVLLIMLSLVIFGVDLWLAYAAQGAMLKTVILENGWGTWHRMISAFVLVRHLDAAVALAYAAQALVSAVVAWLVLARWRADGATPTSFAMLLLGVLLGSIYVSDYDCVSVALVLAWAWPVLRADGLWRSALAVLTPLLAAPLAVASGVALGAFMLWPLFLSIRRKAVANRASQASMLRPSEAFTNPPSTVIVSPTT